MAAGFGARAAVCRPLLWTSQPHLCISWWTYEAFSLSPPSSVLCRGSYGLLHSPQKPLWFSNQCFENTCEICLSLSSFVSSLGLRSCLIWLWTPRIDMGLDRNSNTPLYPEAQGLVKKRRWALCSQNRDKLNDRKKKKGRRESRERASYKLNSHLWKTYEKKTRKKLSS